MTIEAIEIDAESRADASTKRNGKARLLSLNDLDGRTAAAQFVRDTCASIISDIAGEESELSTLERTAVENVALTAAMIRDAGVRWLKGEPMDPATIATLTNTFNRTAAMLGWQRRAKDVTPTLGEYLAAKAAEKPLDSPK